MESETPKRIQRKRFKGWRMPENTVYVGRPSKWGNPYHIGECYIDEVFEDEKLVEILTWDSIDAKTAVQFFEEAITKKYPAVQITVEEIIAELRGKNLACWCPVDQPCHADVLLKIANMECKKKNVEYIFVYDRQRRQVSEQDLVSMEVKNILWWGVVFTKYYSKKIRNRERYYRRYKNIGKRMKKTRQGRRK